MHTHGRLRIKAAQPLEVTASARLEAHHLVTNAVVDGRIIAHVKMQMPQVAERPPIAAIEYPILLHVEGPGDDLPLIPCYHKTKIALEALSEQIEETGLQVLSAPVELVNLAFIESKHPGIESLRNLFAAQCLNLDPLLFHLAHFPLDLIAPFGAKVREIIIERAIPMIEPLIL